LGSEITERSQIYGKPAGASAVGALRFRAATVQAGNGTTTSENQKTPKTRISKPAATPMDTLNVDFAGGLTLTVTSAPTAMTKAADKGAA